MQVPDLFPFQNIMSSFFDDNLIWSPLTASGIDELSTKVDSHGLSIFGPMDYTHGYAYPLIVWLHSDFGNEAELLELMPMLSLRNYVGLAPEGFHGCTAPSGENIAWPMTRVEETSERVYEAIRQVRYDYNINSARIFVAGRRSGGTMALWLALSNPGVFAGAASFDGLLPVMPRMFGQFRKQALQAFYLGVTANSLKAAPQRWYRDINLLNTSGISATYKEYRGSRQYEEDRDLLAEMMTDLNRWIMGQISSRCI